jgi:hypothetical protein
VCDFRLPPPGAEAWRLILIINWTLSAFVGRCNYHSLLYYDRTRLHGSLYDNSKFPSTNFLCDEKIWNPFVETVGRRVNLWKHAHKTSTPRNLRDYECSGEARCHSNWTPNTNAHFSSLKTFFCMAKKALVRLDLLIIEASLSHSFRHTSLATTHLDE